MKNKMACATTKVLLSIALVSMLLLNISQTHVNAQGTVVKVNPSTLTLGEANVTLPTPPGTINITITDVTDLYAWQIKLLFENSTLNRTAVWLPDDHVFSYTNNTSGLLVSPQPGDPDWGAGYVTVYLTLIGIETTFSGSGTLCQINFTGVAFGTSALTFSGTGPGEDTFLLDFDVEDITFTVTDGSITVVPEFPTFVIVPSLMILTLVALIIAKRKWSNKRYISSKPLR